MRIGKLKFPDNTIQTQAGVYTPGQIVYANDADPFWYDTVLSMNMESLIERKGKVVTAGGNAVISATQKKFGNTSAFFDGTGDYLTTPSSADFAFGTLDFTIECWVYIEANSAASPSNARSALIFGTDNGAGGKSVEFVVSGDASTTGTGLSIWNGSVGAGVTVAISQDAWHHIAVSRKDGVAYFAVDGVVSSVAYAESFGTAAGYTAFIGGCTGGTYNYYLNGYIDDLRITKGVARYVANFTPPTAAFPTSLVSSTVIPMANQGDPFWSDVTLALTMDNLTDLRGSIVTASGGAAISTTQSKFGGKSCSFNGTSSMLSIAAKGNSHMSFGSNSFTVEGWFWVPNLTGNKTIITGNSDFSLGVVILDAALRGYASSNGSAWNIHDYFGSATVTANAWHHFAFQRDGDVWSLYYDGVLSGQATNSAAVITRNEATVIGRWGNNDFWMNGYIDDLRITNGRARYSANFTPTQPNPTFAYQPTNVAIPGPAGADGADGAPGASGVSGFEQAFLLMGV